MTSQYEKAVRFRALHEGPGAFIIPNPWDLGTARILEQSGFKALATTSAGLAYSLGRRDNAIGRDQVLAHLRSLTPATELPVSADLENGFGDSPQTAAETIQMAAGAGVVGGSIEDATGRAAAPIYDITHAVERIQAAVEAARALPFPFTLTARCENFLNGRPDLDDTIRRLVAYEAAGADVLYAPGLTSAEQIRAVVSVVRKPVNVVMGLQGVSLGMAQLSQLGVRRVSVGSALARAALGAFVRAAEEMQKKGTFEFAAQALSSKDLAGRFPG